MKNILNSAVESNGTAGAYSIQHPATASVAAQSLTPEDKLLAAMGNDKGDEPHPSDERSCSLLNLFTSCQVLSDEEIEGDCSLFQWGRVNMMERQNIVSLKAPAKAGKTFVLTTFASAFLKGDFYGLRSYATESERMLFVDTEQARNSTRKVLKRILKEAPAAGDRLMVTNVRNVAAADRLPLIEMWVDHHKPTLIIIDGIVDLIPGMDYNDQASADKVIAWLGSLAEQNNAVVICAIHTNKGDSTQATGWLGRTLLQKCAVEMGLKREGDKRTITFVTRDQEVDPIPVTIEPTEDKLGRIRILSDVEVAEVENDRKRADLIRKLAERGVEPPLKAAKSDLVRMIAANTGKSPDTSRKFIDSCIAAGVLTIDPNKFVEFAEV